MSGPPMSGRLPKKASLAEFEKQAEDLLQDYREGLTQARMRAGAHLPSLSGEPARGNTETDLTLQEARQVIAREHGYPEWSRLAAAIAPGPELSAPIAALRKAINTGDVDGVRRVLEAHPHTVEVNMTLNRSRRCAPLRFAAGDNAEGPNQVPIVRLLIESGADPQDDVLSRAATQGNVPVMEELLAQGVDPATHYGGGTIMGPCESLNPDGLRFLLQHGADPNYRDRDGSALDMVLNTYQHEHREECLELLVQAGASYTDGAEMDILRGRIDLLRARLAGDPRLVDAHSGFRQQWETGFGGFFGGAPLHRPTLLHICAEYGALEAARVLIAAGADVNRRAQPAGEGFGNQTPVFHAVASNHNRSFPVLRLLLENGADLAVRANIRVPGPEGESTLLRDVTPREYAARYPNDYQPGPGSGPDKGLDTRPHRNVLELLG